MFQETGIRTLLYKNIRHHYEDQEPEPTRVCVFIHTTKVFATNYLALLETHYALDLN